MKILHVIEPMLAEYAAGEDVYETVMNHHNGLTFAELKYDGYRMQLHKKGSELKAFTRNLNDVPLQIYPELASSIRNLPDCVLDCELNGGIGHTGFKAVKGRFRFKETDMNKYKKKADLKKKLELRVFDVLNFDGKWLMNQPLIERRMVTEKIDEARIKPGMQWKVSSPGRLEELFNEIVEKKNEGLVCKNPFSFYVPKARGTDWIKLKKFETLDLVLMGAYLADGQISQLLCGCYNEEKKAYETLAKVNAKREGLSAQVAGLLKGKFIITKPSAYLLSPRIKEKDIPNVYVSPEDSIVMEIKAMNIQHGRNWHSCGFDGDKSYSLRISWAKQIRDDKKPHQATTAGYVAKLYEMQEA